MDINTKLAEVLAEDEQPVTITIYQPDGEPYLSSDGKEATLSLLGSESKKVRAAQDKALRRFVRSHARGLNEAEEARQNRITIATAALVGWSGWEFGEKPADPTPENSALLFRDSRILAQAEEAIAKHASFFREHSVPSSNGAAAKHD